MIIRKIYNREVVKNTLFFSVLTSIVLAIIGSQALANILFNFLFLLIAMPLVSFATETTINRLFGLLLRDSGNDASPGLKINQNQQERD